MKSATKPGIIEHKVNVSSVAEIGVIEVHTRGSSQELYAGRGVEAPEGSADYHNCGSQGKH